MTFDQFGLTIIVVLTLYGVFRQENKTFRALAIVFGKFISLIAVTPFVLLLLVFVFRIEVTIADLGQATTVAFFVVLVVFVFGLPPFRVMKKKNKQTTREDTLKDTAPEQRREEEFIRQHRAEVETRRKAEEETVRQQWAEVEEKRKAEEAMQLEVEIATKKKQIYERELAEKTKVALAKKLAQRFTDLKSNLPFHTSKKPPSAELAEHDKRMWDDVKKLVKEQDSKKATLYFVKIKSLMDDNEYYKIGMTTAGVEARFKKSTQVELLETVCSFDTELYKAAYLEYHFLREFRLYDGLAGSLDELRPEVGFSGYTEVVRSNSVSKISEFFGELDVYNQMK